MTRDWTQLVPRLVRVLYWMCAISAVLFAILFGVSLWAGSPPRTVITFAALAALETFVCFRIRQGRYASKTVRDVA